MRDELLKEVQTLQSENLKLQEKVAELEMKLVTTRSVVRLCVSDLLFPSWVEKHVEGPGMNSRIKEKYRKAFETLSEI
jgi:hypothetical protein